MKTALCFDYAKPSTLLLLKEPKRPSPFSAIRGSYMSVKKRSLSYNWQLYRSSGISCVINPIAGMLVYRAAARIDRDFVSFATRAVS